MSVCGDKQGRARQGRAARADTRPLDLLVARSNRLGVSVMEVLGGGGKERPVKQRAKNRAGSFCNRPLPTPPPTPSLVGLNVGPRHYVLPPPPPTSGPAGLNVGPCQRKTRCIMHRVHTSVKYIYTYIIWFMF